MAEALIFEFPMIGTPEKKEFKKWDNTPDNIYDRYIIKYMDKNEFTIMNIESINYVFEIRCELIDRLQINDSPFDSIVMKLIINIENTWIRPVLNDYVKWDLPTPQILKDFKPFEYKPQNGNLPQKPKIPKWGNEIVEILFKEGELKHNELALKLDEIKGFPQSYLNNLTKIFKTESAKKFFQDKIIHENGYWKLKDPDRI